MITLLHGDCRELLKTLPDQSVQCVVTSPPYWGLRKYTDDPREIGNEPTPAAYVQSLADVFTEVWRVLRNDGVLFLNLGDSYANDTKWGGKTSGKHAAGLQGTNYIGRNRTQTGLPSKSLIGLPWRVAFALQDAGWVLRTEIIWEKPNAMPESVTDRPTRSHEYVFLMSKSARYFYDAAAIAEPSTAMENRGGAHKVQELVPAPGAKNDGFGERWQPSGTRNKRTVWTIATQPYSGAHYATMPEALIAPCILAGSSAQACEQCGAAWVRVVESTGHVNTREAAHVPGNTASKVDSTGWAPTSRATDRLAPACACPGNTGSAASTVLDPFGGSGTVGKVALRYQRNVVLIELNHAYIEEHIDARTDGVQVELFV